MEEGQHKACLITLSLLAATSVSLVLLGRIELRTDVGVRTELPGHLGEWVGHSLLHCQRHDCLATYPINELSNTNTCPRCHGILAPQSYPEKMTLPADTTIVKKRYTDPTGTSITCTLVLMGTDRTSIHRPEGCLVGQGYSVTHQQPLTVETDRGVITVTALNIADAHGKNKSDLSCIYWFIGPRATTHQRGNMQFRMAINRLLHNRADRWAYVLLVAEQHDTNRGELSAFISAFHTAVAY